MSAILSIALHALLIAVLAQLALVPYDWVEIFIRSPEPTPVERIGFLQLPRGEPPAEYPRPGGDNRPVRPAPAPVVPAIAPPAAIPPAVRLPPLATPRPPEGGAGPLVGGGGDARGVRPSYSDPRIWAPPAPVVTAPRTVQERLDSAVTTLFRALSDSMLAAAPAREPGDWTFRVGAQRFGIDQRFIRLGPVSIPTAALALLPLNVQGNPVTMERDRRLAAIRQEILEQAMRAQRDDDFKEAVRALRERKQKEREEEMKKKKADPAIVP
jgi:hypothetical protein